MADDFHFWSETFDRSMENIFAVLFCSAIFFSCEETTLESDEVDEPENNF